MDGGVGSFTLLSFDGLLTPTPARPEAHRTPSLPLRPLWVNPAVDLCRMLKAVCAPFGRLNLSGIATLNTFPYHAFGRLVSAAIASALLSQPPVMS